MTSAHITGLYIYPVKSCRGVQLTEMQIEDLGPVNDRRWMLVDEKNQFLTLRTLSKLAEIKTSLQGPFLHLYAGANKILVNTQEECEQIEEVTIWGESFKAGIENKSINDALSDFLSKTVKLVRYQSQSFRGLGEAGTEAVKQTTFTDSRPILLTNEASLNDLNERLKAQDSDPSQMERFRANIVIQGMAAYQEDEISHFTFKTINGDLILTNPKLCGRCPVITQEVETGKVISKETLTTLAGYRKKEGSSKVPFGVYLTPQNSGMLKLGDRVVVSTL